MNPYDCGFQISNCGLIKQKKLEGFSKAEFGTRKGELKSVAQSVQKVENKRITTEGHGAARKDFVYKFVVSV
jgi:hypothetical protein